MKKKLKAILSIVLVVAIIIGVVCVCLVKKKESDKTTKDTVSTTQESNVNDNNSLSVNGSLGAGVKTNMNYNYTCFSEGFTDVLVVDENSAIKAVGSVSNFLGIGNVNEELKVIDVQMVDGDSYYRMQQYHNSIPVYGRSVVVFGDETGRNSTLTSNYKPVSEGLSLIPTVSYDKVTQSIKKYLNLDEIQSLNISDDNLVIYNFDNIEALAYCVYIGTAEIIVDASSGKVLNYNQRVSNTSAEVWSDDGSVSSIGWQNDDGSYHLYNDEYKITVFNNVNSETIYVDFKDYGIDTMYSADGIFNKDAIITLNDVMDISDYYENLGFDGFERVHVAINDEYDDGENARGGGGTFDDVDSAVLFFGSEFDYNCKDVMAHEYTHAVTCMVVDWTGNDIETSALKEAYSDIFGILYENPENPDWNLKLLSIERDLVNPARTNCYDNMSDIDESDNYDQYTLSTIVSHAAYLMWNGVNGREEGKIDATTLSEIWYRSMLTLPSDADISQCRNAVELAARTMYKNGKLTKEQLVTVFAAFEVVGIENATYTYSESVTNKFDLSVLSSLDTENTEYNLEVMEFPESSNGENNEKPTVIMKKDSVSGKESLELEDGTYIIRLNEKGDEGNTVKTIDVKIVVDSTNNDAKSEIVINTDFKDIKSSSVPADAVEYNGRYYKVFDDCLSWYEAESRCNAMGGHLVTITSQGEQAFVAGLISGGANNCYWLGATRSGSSWRWVTGESFGYANWKGGEPNNQGDMENCLEIYLNTYDSISTGQWNDIMSDGRNGELDKSFYSGSSVGYICEWEY